MSRPFFNESITRLEAVFQDPKSDRKLLELLLEELSFRSTDKARKLKILVLARINSMGSSSVSKAEIVSSAQTAEAANDQAVPRPTYSNKQNMDLPPTNNAADILSAWIALEVLSPQTFRRRQDLAGAMGTIAELERSVMPWDGNGERSRPNYRLYYQVILGTINFEKAVSALLDVYADARVERPATKGEAILAIVILDKHGRLVEDEAAYVSSFAWGFPQALKSELQKLSGWKEAEANLSSDLDRILRRTNDSGEELPLDILTITKARDYLIRALKIPDDFVTNISFAVRAYQYYTNADAPEPLFLNSFFIGDLITAQQLLNEGKASSNLQRYLALKQPHSRQDLRNDRNILERVIAPANIPAARWPGVGRHSLVLLQQAAVNLALNELQTEGILAVNGPPGTGKTTLLRDIVAGVVANRAEAMCGFDDPAKAFVYSGQRISVGQAFLTLYKLDDSLKGFEILIASSNNKAVENISAELPGAGAIAKDMKGLRYFTCLSDALIERESWGLIAAVLGNATNRSRFRNSFWWDKEVGLSTYLAEAGGTPQFVDIVDEQSKKVIGTRKPRIVVEEDAPRSHEEALERWQNVKISFQSTLQKSRTQLAALEKLRQTVNSCAALEREEATAKRDLEQALSDAGKAEKEADKAGALNAVHENRLKELQQSLANHLLVRPGFFARLFGTSRARLWKRGHASLMEEVKTAREKFLESSTRLDRLKEALAKNLSIAHQNKSHLLKASDKLSAANQEIEAARRILGSHIIDRKFFALPHEEKQTISPWCDGATQLIRDDVFMEAMRVHKAFIDAAAKPLKHNLGALMTIFSGKTMSDVKKQSLVADLWASLFLVVPSVSTTFASVERMLGKLPPETLGWLLIDEAGQALPQAAVGALMRTKRAVVVGDPMQIEPIVALPGTLTQNLCRQFGVDPGRFNAPEASAQTLADAATAYYTEFEGRLGSRSVGVPLLVHRRCEDPMFSISNAIAYNRLMVQAKRSGSSSVRELLGASRWISVKGRAIEKWCPEEGEVVMDILWRLRNAGIAPELYIVTPFVIVADNLRRLIHDSGVLQGWIENGQEWIYERVGTVHTVQGREAEAILFVLGAPQAQQAGARNWAGGRPNLLNVAVTRAKEVLYVIGNRELWQDAGVFNELSSRLP
jgi:hypothetical protein